jgi:hypothetical protein
MISSIFAWLDPTRGKTTIAATIETDLTDPAWAQTGPVAVADNGDGTYRISDDGTSGAAQRYVAASAAYEYNHPVALVVDVVPDALDWLRIALDGSAVDIYVNGSTGAHTVASGSPTVTATAISGGYRFTITYTPTASLVVQLQPTDSDVTTTSTLASSETAADVEIVSVTQVRMSAHDSQVATAPASQLADGDQEAAGTTDWTAINATLSKQAGSPGGSGSQVLRVANSGAAAGYAHQTDSAIQEGDTVTVTGWARSQDGVGAPRVSLGSTTIWTGSTSTSWAQFSGTVTAPAANSGQLRLLNTTTGAGDAVEFDDLVITVRRALDMTQATDASMPVVSSDTIPGIGYDGVDDDMATAMAQASYDFLHDGTGATWFVVFRPRDVATGGYMLSTCLSFSQVGVRAQVLAGAVAVRISNGTGVALADASSVALVDDTLYVLAVTMTGTTLACELHEVGGSSSSFSDPSFTGSPSAADSTGKLYLGNSSNGTAPLAADINELVIYREALGAGQRNQVVGYLVAKYAGVA